MAGQLATREQKKAAYDRGFAAGKVDSKTVIYHAAVPGQAARNAGYKTICEESSYALGYEDGFKSTRRVVPIGQLPQR